MDDLNVRVTDEMALLVRQELILFETDLIVWLDNPRNTPLLYAVLLEERGTVSMPEMQSWLSGSSQIQIIFRRIRSLIGGAGIRTPRSVPVGIGVCGAVMLGSARDMVAWLSDMGNARRAARQSCILARTTELPEMAQWFDKSHNAQLVFVKIRELMGGPVPQSGLEGLAGLAARASM